MSEVRKNSSIGMVLKDLLKQRSLSMRKLSELSEIDTATISRIVNGKRKATPEHLKKFADCLGVPFADLFCAAGYLIEQKPEKSYSDDLYATVDNIEKILESSNLYNKKFTIESVEKHLAKYEQFSQTEEGKETILKNFEKKLQKLGGIGPFISHLKVMFEQFSTKKATSHQLAIIGSALLYFILPVDVIPDYIFPIGYLDDAVAVQLASDLLSMKK
ncbi:DNA-binding protein [Bacillus sp. MUM 116]|uniref:helix-turn-helix domain-containing protein n=1 Tax=Bacillus sp. MUM 116 TaxID=1678002 RepID=UPI0008F5D08E|nr:helix-turn-helix domain-containing protein [Bacillus sp. MUM 116]OIK11045.1 DNA-binding protein [Bacillus sp. MUM 116]